MWMSIMSENYGACEMYENNVCGHVEYLQISKQPSQKGLKYQITPHLYRYIHIQLILSNKTMQFIFV
jgi:hypothetical protein